jgi:protein PsiE
MSSWAWFAIMKKKYSGNQTGAQAVDTAEEPQAGTGAARGERRFALGLFHLIERLLLVVIVAMTVLAVIFEILTIYGRGNILLADILLMFLYLEVVGMVSVYYAKRNSVFVYPIFIAITAVGRLVVLQGKEMAPANILIEAAAILLLALSALVIIWAISKQPVR